MVLWFLSILRCFLLPCSRIAVNHTWRIAAYWPVPVHHLKPLAIAGVGQKESFEQTDKRSKCGGDVRIMPVSKTQQLIRKYSLTWMTMQLLRHRHCCRITAIRRLRTCSFETTNPAILPSRYSWSGAAWLFSSRRWRRLEIDWQKSKTWSSQHSQRHKSR